MNNKTMSYSKTWDLTPTLETLQLDSWSMHLLDLEFDGSDGEQEKRTGAELTKQPIHRR